MDIKEFMSVKENEKPLDRIVSNGGFCSIFRTIACIGDSLSSGEFESINDEGNTVFHDFYEYSWGQYLARDCGSKVYNFSMGGMSASQYIQTFAPKHALWSRDKVAQAYIIALGVNDLWCFDVGSVNDINKEDYTQNAKTFAGYYAQIIQRIKELQPRAKIFLVSMQKGLTATEKKKEHRDLLEEFTKFFDNTYLIDLYTYAPEVDDEYKRKFALGHLTPAGYLIGAKMIESYIDFIIRSNPEEFNQVGFIGTDLYFKSKE